MPESISEVQHNSPVCESIIIPLPHKEGELQSLTHILMLVAEYLSVSNVKEWCQKSINPCLIAGAFHSFIEVFS